MDFGRKDYNELFKCEPNSLDEHLASEEPVFLLRGSDPLAPKILLDYATSIRLSGSDPRVADSAVAHAQKMINWQKRNGTKYADFIRESEESLEDKSRILELVEKIEVDGTLSDKDWDELLEKFDAIYGQDSLLIFMRWELEVIDGTYQLTSDQRSKFQKAWLVLHSTTENGSNKLNILKNRL